MNTSSIPLFKSRISIEQLKKSTRILTILSRKFFLLFLLPLFYFACDDQPSSSVNTQNATQNAGTPSSNSGFNGGASSSSGEEVLAGTDVQAGSDLAGQDVLIGGAEIGGEMNASDHLWSTQEVFEGLSPTCAPCHSAGQSSPFFESLTQFERLLVAQANWIVPGRPEQSSFLRLLEGSFPGPFMQMPPSELAYAARESELRTQIPPAPTMLDLNRWIEALNEDDLMDAHEEVLCADLPLRTVLSRLNRNDYQRAAEDLLGTALHLAPDLPAENESYGFTHLGELLTLSPLLIEKLDLAAQALADEAVPDRFPNPSLQFFEGESDMTSSVGAAASTFWNLWAQGDLSTPISIERAGQYEIRVSVGGGQAGPDPVRFALVFDGIVIGEGSTWAVSPQFEQITFVLPLEAGEHTISIRFLNDYYCIEEGFLAGRCPEIGDRNLHFDSLYLNGPIYEERPSSVFEQRYLHCDLLALGEGRLSRLELETCTKETISDFLSIAWRTPLEIADIDRAWRLVSDELQNDPPTLVEFSKGLRNFVYATLLSPRFLFKEEPSAVGASLNDHERAVRLASLIWRSVPDQQLLEAAGQGRLSSTEGINAEILRMLQDPRALRLAEEFGGRWLSLHHLDVSAPDYQAFPNFNDDLRASMYQETVQVLKTIIHENRSILDLIDADFTWLNPQLANHYGLSAALDPALGNQFQRVALPQAGRLGALTHGAWLTVTSHPTRTSPVVRGKWVLENLLCMPPPPPPPGVEGLPTMVDQDASVRARLEQHRADPACAACHTHMDAIGFGFEQFDGIGSFRVSDAGRTIDPSGSLPPYLQDRLNDTDIDSVGFEDTVSLVQALRADPRVSRCIAERFVVYAMGRGLRADEHCYLDEIITIASDEGMSMAALVEAVALSPLFLTRGEERP